MEAHWIWDTAEEHPRNYWACFRRSFTLAARPTEAVLSLFADSRYVAYVNGQRVGQGPARGWPSHGYVDSYPVTGLLKAGANVVAILVHHFGASTMQYVEAEACLTAELSVSAGGTNQRIVTDGTWKTRPHDGFARNAIRNYPQRGWSEIYDANPLDDSWTGQPFDDSAWSPALPLPPGSPAWKRVLLARDIPLMREDVVYPARLHGSRAVRVHGTPVNIDLRPVLSPRDDRDMNKKTFVAGLVTIITAAEDVRCDIEFPWWRMIQLRGSIRVNGIHHHLDPDGRSLTVTLKKGPNLFVMDISGITHTLATYFRFATDVPLSFAAPVHTDRQFAVIGPYDYRTIISIGIPGPDRPDVFSWDHDAVFTRLSDNPLATTADVERLGLALRPVPEECVCAANLYDFAVNRETLRVTDRAADATAMIMPNADYTTILPAADGLTEVTVDFGRELSGYLEIELTAARGTIVDLYGIECIRNDGTVEHTDGIQCTVRYVARDGWQVYRSPNRLGLRYVQMTFRGADPVRVHRMAMHNATYAAEKAGTFDCADRTLTRVWEIARDTDLLCMEDTFVDCPTYEQVFWVGDARGEALIAYYTFGAYDFVRHGWDIVARSLDRSPITESQVPSGWQNVLTTWSLFWMMGVKEYFDFTGDEAYVRSVYPSLRRNVASFLERVGANDLFAIEAWSLLDWAPMDSPDRGVVTHLNAELTRVLREMAWLARMIGKEADAVEMEDHAGRITRAINRHLWSDQKKAYIDCIHDDGTPSSKVSMQTNTMVYLCDCAEGKRRQAIEKYLRDPPASFVQIGSPFVTFFYYQALVKARMVPVMLADIRKNYGMMLDEGATSCWETFPGFEKGRLTRSHCHGWSAAPAFFMGAYVLGVRPLEPGFTRTLIDPDLGDLPWATGSVPTPHGRIDIRCEKRGAKVVAHVRAPRGVELVAGRNVILE